MTLHHLRSSHFIASRLIIKKLTVELSLVRPFFLTSWPVEATECERGIDSSGKGIGVGMIEGGSNSIAWIEGANEEWGVGRG